MMITISITRDEALALCNEAEIYVNESYMPNVPNGVFYDTHNGRWTWALDEAAQWAAQSIAGGSWAMADDEFCPESNVPRGECVGCREK